jgi:hypothetical protein
LSDTYYCKPTGFVRFIALLLVAESRGASPSFVHSIMASPYIGSTISLVSKAEIRYVGTLYQINTEDATVALQNGAHAQSTTCALGEKNHARPRGGTVRSFGTEGRATTGPAIPASDQVFEFIVFRGADIKDLNVEDKPAPAPSVVSFAGVRVRVRAAPACG